MQDGTEESGRRLARLMTGDADPGPGGAVIAGIPHCREMGMRLMRAGGGVAVLSVPWDARLVGDPENGVLHGGVITALLDTACGIAVMTADAPLAATATLDLRIDYMRPATTGLAVSARAECYRLTRAIAFARAVAYHETPDDPVASAAGAFILERDTSPEGRGGAGTDG